MVFVRKALPAHLRTSTVIGFMVRQFGYTKVRYRSLAKSAAQVVTIFALSNLWMARRCLLQPTG